MNKSCSILGQEPRDRENPIVWEDINKIVSDFKFWEFFLNKRVIITGASGLLASYLVRTLLRANDCMELNLKVTGLIRTEPTAGSRLMPWINHPNLYLVYGNAESYPYDSLDPHSIIIHAASLASPRTYSVDPVGTLLPNSVGTFQLCEQARKWKSSRFLYFSTGEVYGVNSKEELSEIDFGYLDPNTVRSCYAESKRMGETTCIAYAHQHGVHTTSVRIFHTYGPQMNLEDGRVFADFVRDALNGKPIALASSGSAKRCFCYIADAVTAFLLLIVKGVAGGAYNLANPNAEISILDLGWLIGSLVEPNLPVVSVDPSIAKPDYVGSPVLRSLPSILRLKTLGWQPDTSLKTGFTRTLLSYQS